MISMKMAHHHTRDLGGVDAGSPHIGNHPADGGASGGHTIATIKHHQIAAGIKEGDGIGYHHPVLRQEGITQYALHFRKRRIADETFKRTGHKTIMHRSHGK